jgi:inorganic pyrophosphatase/exopolyphosphatase
MFNKNSTDLSVVEAPAFNISKPYFAKVDIQKYGLDMLKAGASTTDKSVEFLLNMDAKSFTMGDYVTRIAQVNAVDLDGITINDVSNNKYK